MTAGPRTAGFTLLELLVAMALLALIMAMLFGGLRTGARVWEATDSRGEEIARLQAAQGFVRRQVAALLPRVGRVRGDGEDDGAAVALAGEDDAFTFVGLLPAHFGVGGLQRIRIGAADDGNDGRALAVEWSAYDPHGAAPARVPDEQRSVLIGGVEDVAFSYFGAVSARDAPDWSDAWQNRDAPPLLVRLALHFPAGDRRYWPEMIIRVPTAPRPSAAAALRR